MKKIFVSCPNLSGNEKKYVNECMDSTWISSKGKFITLFEKEFANFCGVKHALSCSNGTVAIHLALEALSITSGDEVIVPAFTYIATANAVRYTGATPVFAESDEHTWNIDPESVRSKITSRTKAIIVVHLYGNPVDMDPIMEIAKEYNLYVIEDAAEAHGAQYKGRSVGSIGHVGTFSFFGNKVMTTGEGGMVVTNDDGLAAKMSLLKGQGVDPSKSYWHTVIGYNYRMTNIEAAIGLAQLEKIGEHIAARQRTADQYMSILGAREDLFSFQTTCADSESICWMFSIVLKDTAAISRDEMIQKLAERGIETRPLFYPVTDLPPYNNGEHFPVAEKIAGRGLNLPTHGLLTNEDIAYVCKNLVELAGGNS